MGRENLEPKSHHRLCLWWPATVGLCEDAEPSLFEVPLRKPWCACVHAHFYAYRQETRHTTKIKCIIPLEIQNSMALSRSYKYIEAKKPETIRLKNMLNPMLHMMSHLHTTFGVLKSQLLSRSYCKCLPFEQARNYLVNFSRKSRCHAL